MPNTYSVIGFAAAAPSGLDDQVQEALQGAGAELKSHNWVRVTGSASDGKDPDAAGYHALTATVHADSLESLRARLQPDKTQQLVEGVDLNVLDPRWRDHDRKKLVVTDVDSTLIRQEVIEMLAAHVGRETEVAAVTERAMRGEIDFEQSLRQRVAVLEGLRETVLNDVYSAVRPSPGAHTVVKVLSAAGIAVTAVSGGFVQILDPLAHKLGLARTEANVLEIKDGYLTGRVVGNVVDGARKAACVRQWAQELGVAPEDVMAVGDGANDIEMAQAAGLSVAYNAKPALREVADTQLNIPNLDALRFFLDL